MPTPGKRWYHITIGTNNSWLPGDPRGFRSRNHKIHSSGDHKNPPPKDEHAGLYDFSQSISGQPVILPYDLRTVGCDRIVQTLLSRKHRVLVLSVGGMHIHALAELPNDHAGSRHEIGVVKKSASQAISHRITGNIWAKGCGLKPIRNEEHQRNTYLYIKRHIDEGSYLWTFRDEA
jgi:REP element-mobilizing transposase RayT